MKNTLYDSKLFYLMPLWYNLYQLLGHWKKIFCLKNPHNFRGNGWVDHLSKGCYYVCLIISLQKKKLMPFITWFSWKLPFFTASFTVCSAPPLIRIPLNANFCYFEEISKFLEFELRKYYVLCRFIGTKIVRAFTNSNDFLVPC